MGEWVKDIPNGEIAYAIELPDKKAKAIGEEFLKTVCAGCLFLRKGSYGLYDGEGAAGSRLRRPYRRCPGIGAPEAKC